IARAKARKAAQAEKGAPSSNAETETKPESTDEELALIDDPKKAAVAAAISRAKARKAAQQIEKNKEE
ncbi:hypothetical protein, partial [Aliivibrio sp. SR45-2]|uniref:hypothetical protein n=1 Tax=Aliivibrio sp. SR45-2 TaxID=2760931 RepID=UPI002104437E